MTNPTQGRTSSGIAGLDIILNGGFLPGSIYLVEGVPGSGKTTLGIQFIHSGIVDHGESGLIITFEEFPDQMERDSISFGWDLKALQRDGKLAILSTSPEALIRMLEEPGGPIDQLSASGNLSRVLVDSVTHFQSATSDPSELRRIVFAFMNGLRRLGVTALLTKEIERDEAASIPFEEYLVDGIIRMTNAPLGMLRRTRHVEVVKSRGQPHLAGKSGFRFGPSGIEVFPRLSSNWASHSHWLPEIEGAMREERGDHTAEMSTPAGQEAELNKPMVRVSTGCAGIDAMLNGGLIRGSSGLVAGTSGTGKTLLCLQFLHAGLVKGEPAVILTVEESATRLIQFASSVGLEIKTHFQKGLLRIECCSPADISPGEALWRLYRLVRSTGAGRVVVDSLNSLFGGDSQETGLIQTATQNLVCLFENMGITSLMTWELQDITGDLRISDHGMSAVLDSLILLRYVEVASEMRRVIGIIKSRGSEHDRGLREFRITNEGFRIENKLEGLSGVLRGSAQGTRKEAIEEFVQPLVYIQDVAAMIRRNEIPVDKVDAALDGLSQEAERVLATIKERMLRDAIGARPGV